jgi:hypothetical protein
MCYKDCGHIKTSNREMDISKTELKDISDGNKRHISNKEMDISKTEIQDQSKTEIRRSLSKTNIKDIYQTKKWTYRKRRYKTNQRRK